MDGADSSTQGFLLSSNCHFTLLAYVNQSEVFVTASIHVNRMFIVTGCEKSGV